QHEAGARAYRVGDIAHEEQPGFARSLAPVARLEGHAARAERAAQRGAQVEGAVPRMARAHEGPADEALGQLAQRPLDRLDLARLERREGHVLDALWRWPARELLAHVVAGARAKGAKL